MKKLLMTVLGSVGAATISYKMYKYLSQKSTRDIEEEGEVCQACGSILFLDAAVNTLCCPTCVAEGAEEGKWGLTYLDAEGSIVDLHPSPFDGSLFKALDDEVPRNTQLFICSASAALLPEYLLECFSDCKILSIHNIIQ